MLSSPPLLLACLAAATALGAVEPHPLVTASCLECHGATAPEAGLDLRAVGTNDTPTLLTRIRTAVASGEMPPPDAAHPFTESQRVQLLAWLDRDSTPDDPGIVVAPQLTHHQYRRAIRDLTGYPIDPSGVLPVASAGPSGFPNDGSAQRTSPQQVAKLLEAARFVASHAGLSPRHGIVWYPTPIAPTPDAAIDDIAGIWVALHRAQHQRMTQETLASLDDPRLPGRAGSMFELAWRLEHRHRGDPSAAASVAAAYERPVEPLAIRKWHRLMTSRDAATSAALGDLVAAWRAIPRDTDDAAVRAACRTIDARLRARAALTVDPWSRSDGPGLSRGATGSARREWREAFAAGTQRVWIDHAQVPGDGSLALVIAPSGDGADGDRVLVGGFAQATDQTRDDLHPWDPQPRAALGAIHSRRADGALEAQAPAIIHLTPPPEAPRWLHLTVTIDPELGADATVQIGVVRGSDAQHQLPGISGAPLLAHPACARAAAQRAAAVRLNQLFTDHAAVLPRCWFSQMPGLDPTGLNAEAQPPVPADALWRPFGFTPRELRAAMDSANRRLVAAMASQLGELRGPADDDALMAAAETELLRVAERAWRHPLDAGAAARLVAFLRAQHAAGRSPLVSLRLGLMAVLMHPDFLYRVPSASDAAEPTPLGPWAVASRLSFALWGTLPDAELLAVAADASLLDPVHLRRQVRRMLADPCARALITDFADYWLDLPSLTDVHAIPGLSPSLAAAARSELDHLLHAVIRGEAPIRDLLDAEYSYLNQTLAALYGIDGVVGPELRRVALPPDSGRGGLITTLALLTATAETGRTSPTRRGAWVQAVLLDRELPPPAAATALPAADAHASLAERLRAHRWDPACAGCHAQLDPIGLALEGFDHHGRRRPMTTGEGHALPDGSVLQDAGDLRALLRAREDRFIARFGRGLLAHVLGRAPLPSDAPLLARMSKAMRAADGGVPVALELLVTSPQFRLRRNANADGGP